MKDLDDKIWVRIDTNAAMLRAIEMDDPETVHRVCPWINLISLRDEKSAIAASKRVRHRLTFVLSNALTDIKSMLSTESNEQELTVASLRPGSKERSTEIGEKERSLLQLIIVQLYGIDATTTELFVGMEKGDINVLHALVDKLETPSPSAVVSTSRRISSLGKEDVIWIR